VTIGRDSSIWYNAVLRGDVNPIRIGDRTNIQDGATLHTLYKKSVVEIGNDVSVGHNANIHGAKIEDNCLIGIGSTLLDGVVVGTGSIVAANSLVLSNTMIAPHTMWAGVPAKKVKDIGPDQDRMIHRNAAGYLKYSEWYKAEEEQFP
jgi:carbonic anhydrase/acetyltransferase-like protein (isoleucine patch superfamily)